jgi:transcriptional regulator with XRE-family HTH domain
VNRVVSISLIAGLSPCGHCGDNIYSATRGSSSVEKVASVPVSTTVDRSAGRGFSEFVSAQAKRNRRRWSASLNLLKLRQTSINGSFTERMASNSVGTYLRFLRKNSGLSQQDLARILGSVSASQVSRHERSRSLPTILAAFGYQVVFQKPASEIFPGLYHTVEVGVEERFQEFENELWRRKSSDLSENR